MTEQEFSKQVWRAYDTVALEGFDKNFRVVAVHFPKYSVRVAIAAGVFEWFKCDQIVSHSSATGNPDDMSIIEDLHNKLLAANQRNENLQLIKNTLEEKLNNNRIGELRKCINLLNGNLIPKKKTIDRIEQALQRLDDVIDQMANLESTEE